MAWVNLNELYVPRETYETDMQDVTSNIEKLQDMMSGYQSGDWFVQKLGSLFVCTIAKSFSISTSVESGYGQTLNYGNATVKIELPITPASQPAAVVNIGNRSGFVASCNFDTSTNELVVTLALMNFTAPDVYIRAIVVAEASQ